MNRTSHGSDRSLQRDEGEGARLGWEVLNFTAQALGHCTAPAGVGAHLQGQEHLVMLARKRRQKPSSVPAPGHPQQSLSAPQRKDCAVSQVLYERICKYQAIRISQQDQDGVGSCCLISGLKE